MGKINWSKALLEYMADETLSYADIAKRYGVSTYQVEEHGKHEGWVALRQQHQAEARQRAIEKSVEEIAEINARHVNIGRMLQSKAIEAIEHKEKPVEIKYFRDANEALVNGVNMERKAMGMDSKDNQGNTNVNVILPDWYLKIPLQKDNEQTNH